MKKALGAISGAICSAYVVLFCVFAEDIVTKHLELELNIPQNVIILSALLACGMFVADRIKRLDKKLYFIPLAVFLSGVITLCVGYFTHCPYCT